MNTDDAGAAIAGTSADALTTTRTLPFRHHIHVPNTTFSARSRVASDRRLPQVASNSQAVLHVSREQETDETGVDGFQGDLSPMTGSQGGLNLEINTPGSSHVASGGPDETRTEGGALGANTTSSTRQWPVGIPYRPAPNRIPATHPNSGVGMAADESNDRAHLPRRLRRISTRSDALCTTGQECSQRPSLTPTTLPWSEDMRPDRKRKRPPGNNDDEPALASGTADGPRRKLKPLSQLQRAERASKRGRVCLQCRTRKVKCKHVRTASAEPVIQGCQNFKRASTSTRTLDLPDASGHSLVEFPSPVSPASQRLPGEQSPSPVASLCDGIGALFHGISPSGCPKCGRWTCASLKIF